MIVATTPIAGDFVDVSIFRLRNTTWLFGSLGFALA
jgi:hypothetical protein